MIEISNEASRKLFDTVERNLNPHSGYGSPPIHYWFRNVIEAIKLIGYENGVKEGNYQESLENSLGRVYYSIDYIGNDIVCLITDFDFNISTIR